MLFIDFRSYEYEIHPLSLIFISHFPPFQKSCIDQISSRTMGERIAGKLPRKYILDDFKKSVNALSKERNL